MPETGGVTNRGARRKLVDTKGRTIRKWRWWLTGGALGIIIIVVGLFAFNNRSPVLSEAPESEKILAAQENLNFGIMIPTYMPKGFDREAMELKVTPSGPSGEPVVDLTYRYLGKKAAIFMRQWVPGNPELEILNKSIPIETKWGKGWLRLQADTIATLWVDIGQVRVDLSSSSMKVVSATQLLQMANSLGLASEQQFYTFRMDPVQIIGISPPPPYIVQVNGSGVQELNLTITPGGYSPVRFQVKKGVPVKINFRAIGEVGCGNTLIMPAGSAEYGAQLTSPVDLKIIEFVPKDIGDFEFYCGTRCYRGIMTVTE